MSIGQLIELRIAIWFTSICVIGCGCFFAWLLWTLFWDGFDHIMQDRKRAKNTRFQARSTRDAFRDMRGTHR